MLKHGNPREHGHVGRLTIALCVCVMLSFALAGLSFAYGHQQNCEARSTTFNVIRDILVSAEKATDSDPTATAAQKVKTHLFVKAAILRIDQSRC